LRRELVIERQPFRLGRRIGVGHDRLGRTFRHAHAAIDAFVGMNDEHVLAFIEAIDRTHLDAVHIFAFDAIIDDYMRHSSLAALLHPIHLNRSPCGIARRRWLRLRWMTTAETMRARRQWIRGLITKRRARHTARAAV